MNKQILFLLVLIGTVGCGSVKPESPDLIVDNEWKIPEQPVSVIDIPIKINLAPYFQETNESVPNKFTGKESTCEGVSYSYTFIRNPIEFSGHKEELDINVKGKYALSLNYCPQCTELFNRSGNCVIPRIYTSCGVTEPMRGMEVGYTTKIGVTEDYKLKAKTSLKKVKAITPCEVTVFDYDATDRLEEEVTKALTAVEKDIDKEIGSVDLKPDIEETWKLLNEPTDLEGYGFLYLNPQSIAISKILYEGDTAYVRASLEAKPGIFLYKPDLPVRPLPELTKYKKSNGFEIAMDIEARYDSLSSILNKNVAGMKTEVKGKEVIFEELNIYGAMDHKISLEVRFSGKKKGIIYLTGTPTFNSEKQELSFPDMEFDIKTKSALLKSAKWLFDKKISDKVREAAQIDLKPYLDSVKLMVDESLNGELDEGVLMKGKVNDVKIENIQPLSDHLFIRVMSEGKLEIAM